MKITKLTTLLIITSAALSQAAWVWDPSTTTGYTLGDASGSTINADITPWGSDPDYTTLNANLEPQGWTAGNSQGFDIAPLPVSFNISSTGGNISLDFDLINQFTSLSVPGVFNPVTLPNRFLLDLDPDNNGLPTDLTIEVTFAQGITERGSGGGAIGLSPMMFNQSTGQQYGNADATLSVTNADGSPGTLDATSSYVAGSSFSFSNGEAVYDNEAILMGLSGQPADYAYPTSLAQSDPAKEIGIMRYEFTEFNLNPGNSIFALSFDGGVSEFSSTPIPEPTAGALGLLAGLGFLARRRR